ncbi:MAG: SCO family protein [Rhodospirillaceae bacterium]|nr:SCO family protein [Rhodospirillaceae bacterium]MDD9917308.1 SCO family protein [Rhodospirillaceae bacterium]MDD9925490.1 SCO family protein [Rhodospirillaceae bacterium]
MTLRIPLIALTALVLTFGQAAAHDGENHAPKPSPTLAAKPPALPFDVKVGGPFTLVDHNGQKRSDKDFRGKYMLIFFGYANCESICPVGLRRMTAALDRLGPAGDKVQPLLISVDATHDTPANMREEVVKVHPRLLGLTGTDAQLKAARKAYQVESKEVSKTKDGKPVYAHGSFVYLMAPDGKLATIIPPVLGDEQMAGIMRRYVN